MDDDLLRRVDNQQFFNWVVESAFEKVMLETQFSGDPALDENEQNKLRALLTIGVAETVIKLRDLIGAYLEEGDG
jgi:hypothetical protein